MYTKTQERVKMIECDLIERCILGVETAKISIRTHEGLRSLSRMKFLTTLLYLGNRLMKSIQIFLYLFPIWKNRYTDFGQKYVKGGEIKEIIKIGMYIFLISKEKDNFSKNVYLSVRPSAKFVYTKT